MNLDKPKVLLGDIVFFKYIKDQPPQKILNYRIILGQLYRKKKKGQK